jgi:tryptophan 2,3-dioxygenase
MEQQPPGFPEKTPTAKEANAVSMPRVAPYKPDQLTYNDYLKVPELLSLQIPQSEPAHHDEYLFIIIHQSYELWFKLMLHELEKAMDFMRQQEILKAHHFIKRAVAILRAQIPQIHLLETMRPVDFLYFRDRLNPASGFQSIQFRELEYLMGLKNRGYLRFFDERPDLRAHLEQRLEQEDMREVYYRMLAQMGFDIPEDFAIETLEKNEEDESRVLQALLALYRHPEDQMALYLLTETLMDFDSLLITWREHHVQVVSRIIGDKRGTGGSTGVDYLRRTTLKQCFPYLWRVRTLLSL